MPYAQTCDLNTRFGASNITAWSNLDNTSSNPDTNRIAAALGWASEYIDNRLRRSKYLTPLASNSGSPLLQVTDWAAVLAGWWLYTSRGMRDTDDAKLAKLEGLKSQVDPQIDELLNGQIEIDAQARTPAGPSGPTIY